MSRSDRLLAGPGFAVFTRRPTFAGAVLGSYLAEDDGVRDVLLVPNAATTPEMLSEVVSTVRELAVPLTIIPWERYGEPANVRAVDELRSEGLAIVLMDQRRTVADRLDVRRGYMRRKAARKRVVVDAIPYEVAPWRVYFPFAFFDRSLLGYHHSYAVEQDYERYLDGGLAENPCDPARVVEKTWRAAVVDDVDGGRFFPAPIRVDPIPATPEHHAEYARARDGLFESEKSIASVKAKLAKWIQTRYPARSIPHDLKRVYEPGFTAVRPTDLPFDLWLTNEILGLVDHTNRLLTGYVQKQREAGE